MEVHADGSLFRARGRGNRALRHVTAALLADPGPLALAPILGRSAFQRHLHHLARVGVGRVYLPALAREAASGVDGETREEYRRQRARLGPGTPRLIFGAPDPASGGERWVVRATAVFDPRLYDAVASAPGPVRVIDDGADTPVPVGLCRLPADGAAGSAAAGTTELPISKIPVYVPSLRRWLPPFWHDLRSPADVRAAASSLLDATQKGVLDFPAKYLHPAPENALTRMLAGSSVTPNQVTVATGVLGFLAAYLFASGRFGVGLLLALIVNVLDGVDGKLARVTLTTSRFGDRLDHTLDVAFEFAWYLSLGWGLSARTGETWPLWMAAGLVATMTGARAVSGAYRALAGRQIHDHTAFDRAVRLVAGRRNSYVVLLALGWLAGRLAPAFRLAFWWAALTLAVYLLRTGVAAAGRLRR